MISKCFADIFMNEWTTHPIMLMNLQKTRTSHNAFGDTLWLCNPNWTWNSMYHRLVSHLSWSSCSVSQRLGQEAWKTKTSSQKTYYLSLCLHLSSHLHGYSRSNDRTTLLYQPLNTCEISRVQLAGISYFLSYPHSRSAFYHLEHGMTAT